MSGLDFDRWMLTLYSGVEDDRRWDRACDQFSDALGGSIHTFGHADFRSGAARFEGHRTSDEFVTLHSGPLASPDINPFVHTMPAMPAMTPVRAMAIWPDGQPFERSELYERGFADFDLRYGIGAAFETGPSQSEFFTVWRNSRSGEFEDEEIRLVDRAIPHLATAWRLRRWRSDARAKLCEFEALLDDFDERLFLLDGAGELLFANRAARISLSQAWPLVSVGRRLIAVSPRDRSRFEQAVAAASGPGASSTTLAFRDHLGSVATARVGPIEPVEWDGRRLDSRVMIRVGAEPRGSAARHVLMDAYELTPMEAQLAIALAAGEGLAQAARTLRIGINTAKTHKAAIFLKTATHSQAELIVRLSRDGLI